MGKFISRYIQGGVFAVIIKLMGGSGVDSMLAFMIGVSFSPEHFWFFL